MLIARESPWPIPGVRITETVINWQDRWNAHLYGRSVTTPMLMETSITTQQRTNAFYIQSPRLHHRKEDTPSRGICATLFS